MANRKTMNMLGISAFCESLGMMIQAGIQVNEAVYLLEQKGEGGQLAAAVQEMGKSLDEGSTLAAAMRKTDLFPEYAVRMIEAGENTGKLEEVLFRLSSYYREQHTISEKLRSVIIYPAAMLVMIIVVLVIMLKMVLPSFRDVYNSLTGSLAASSYRYIGLAFGFCPGHHDYPGCAGHAGAAHVERQRPAAGGETAGRQCRLPGHHGDSGHVPVYFGI